MAGKMTQVKRNRINDRMKELRAYAAVVTQEGGVEYSLKMADHRDYIYTVRLFEGPRGSWYLARYEANNIITVTTGHATAEAAEAVIISAIDEELGILAENEQRIAQGLCTNCGRPLTEVDKDYSKPEYGKHLCLTCLAGLED